MPHLGFVRTSQQDAEFLLPRKRHLNGLWNKKRESYLVSWNFVEIRCHFHGSQNDSRWPAWIKTLDPAGCSRSSFTVTLKSNRFTVAASMHNDSHIAIIGSRWHIKRRGGRACGFVSMKVSPPNMCDTLCFCLNFKPLEALLSLFEPIFWSACFLEFQS